jgi:WD40 repeat protein
LSLTGGARLQLWDLARGKPVRTFDRPRGEGSYAALAFSVDGRLALSGGGDSPARLWEVATGKPVRALVGKGLPMPVRSAAFSPDGRLALTGGDGQTLKVWDVASGREVRRLRLPEPTPPWARPPKRDAKRRGEPGP